jgi:hypothetical protein
MFELNQGSQISRGQDHRDRPQPALGVARTSDEKNEKFEKVSEQKQILRTCIRSPGENAVTLLYVLGLFCLKEMLELYPLSVLRIRIRVFHQSVADTAYRPVSPMNIYSPAEVRV